MLGFVAWLNVLVRKHDDLGLACLAQSVNVVSLIRAVTRIESRAEIQISPLTTSSNGILRQTIFHP
jgi:alpha-N-arabinofuranosidase